MRSKNPLHARSHDPGGSDPVMFAWEDVGAGAGSGIMFDTEPQSGTYIYATVTGVAPPDDDWGITLGDESDTHGIHLYQGTGGAYSAITLHDYGLGGAVFFDCSQALFNCNVDFQVRSVGGTNTLFTIHADGTIHGKASVGAITWDL